MWKSSEEQWYFGSGATLLEGRYRCTLSWFGLDIFFSSQDMIKDRAEHFKFDSSWRWIQTFWTRTEGFRPWRCSSQPQGHQVTDQNINMWTKPLSYKDNSPDGGIDQGGIVQRAIDLGGNCPGGELSGGAGGRGLTWYPYKDIDNWHADWAEPLNNSVDSRAVVSFVRWSHYIPACFVAYANIYQCLISCVNMLLNLSMFCLNICQCLASHVTVLFHMPMFCLICQCLRLCHMSMFCFICQCFVSYVSLLFQISMC